jgi:hypothetical protein
MRWIEGLGSVGIILGVWIITIIVVFLGKMAGIDNDKKK